MTLYAIIGEDRPDSLAARLAARPAHLERLRMLQDAGRLLLAGPFPAIDAPDPGPAGFSGSLIVAEFASLADARAWADADPYVAADVYVDVVVKPFKKVLPA
ncbi:MAG: YciI family protein [Betaproteobacteria bacterium]|nr:YciI family protein [Betaproteobacteria bacterium]MCL2885895.1 YciI family protein [Betaproteobacteria bacterium]